MIIDPRCDCGHMFEICNHPNCALGDAQQPLPMSEIIRMLTEALNVLRPAPLENAAAIYMIEEARLAALALSSHNCHTAQGE
jgi:hypothetical protein